jgi:hypothetical protein
MSDDENSDYKSLVDNPEIFKKFMIGIRGGYSKKFDLVKKAREILPETFSTRDFANQMLLALEANYSDQIVFLDVLQAIVQNNSKKIQRLNNRVKQGQKIANWWDRSFEDESKDADKKNE